MKNSTKIAKEAGINIAGEMYGGVARFAFIGILARFVGPEFLGIYSIGNAITRIFAVLGIAGLDKGILRYISFNRGENEIKLIKKWINIALKYGFLFGIIVFALQFGLSSKITQLFYNSNIHIQNTIKIFAFILPFSILSGIAAHSTQGYKILKYKVITIQVIQPTALLIILILLYYFNYTYFNQITLPLILAEIIGFVMMFKFLQNVMVTKIKDVINQPLDNEIVKFSFPLLLVGLLGMLMHWIDILMLGYYLNPNEVGIYQPAVRTTGIIRLFLISFTGIFTPMMSEFIANNLKKEMKNIYQLTVRWMLTLSLPFFIIALTRSEQIMNLFGNQYIIGSNIIIILMVGMLFQAIGNPAGSTLVMAGKTKLVLINTIIVALLNIGINIYLIPKLGLAGAALGTAISLIILCAVRIIQVLILYKIHPFGINIFKSIIGGIFLYLVSILLSTYLNEINYFFNLCISSCVLITIYIFLLYMFKFEKEDLEVINFIKIKIKGI
jgi:O-antigen/teichoic acid export membrane protein